MSAANAAAPDPWGVEGSRSDTAIVAPATDMPRVPLWIAVERGYRLAPPGPTTERERRHLAHAAHDRARGYECHRQAIRLLDAELGSV